jgi:hypothetical protein
VTWPPDNLASRLHHLLASVTRTREALQDGEHRLAEHLLDDLEADASAALDAADAVSQEGLDGRP